MPLAGAALVLAFLLIKADEKRDTDRTLRARLTSGEAVPLQAKDRPSSQS